jgi:uncharacterized membrane protein
LRFEPRKVAEAVFAATLIAIGAWGLASGGFAGIWAPVPKAWPAREALAYACAVVALATGGGLLWRRTAAAAAAVLTVFLFAWALAIKAPIVVAASAAASWESLGETVVIAAAAGTLFAEVTARQSALRVARALFGLSLIAFGAAHLAYIKETAALVPSWLPAPAAWVYFTGFAYIAAGVAVVTGVQARLAATLSTVQMGLFTLLVWAPALAAGGAEARSEGAISWALTAAGGVVAASYKTRPRSVSSPTPATPPRS